MRPLAGWFGDAAGRDLVRNTRSVAGRDMRRRAARLVRRCRRAEILLLRHQIAVLPRQVAHPDLEPIDRTALAYVAPGQSRSNDRICRDQRGRDPNAATERRASRAAQLPDMPMIGCLRMIARYSVVTVRREESKQVSQANVGTRKSRAPRSRVVNRAWVLVQSRRTSMGPGRLAAARRPAGRADRSRPSRCAMSTPSS